MMLSGWVTAQITFSIHWTIAPTLEGTLKNMKKTTEDLAIETIFGEYGTGNDRKRLLGDNYRNVQDRVNQYYNVAEQCTAGIWGYGWNRKTALDGAGYKPEIVQFILDRDYAERVGYDGC